MRFKYLKYLAFALGGLSTVIAAGALYLHATFDGLRLAAELTHFAKQRHQRTLRIEGPVELSMFPRLRLQLPAGTLSGRNSTSEFIGFEQASVSVRLLPLLTRRVVVERVEIDGLRMALLRDKAGKLNAADLLGTDDNAPSPSGNEPFDLDIRALVIERGAITWTDERAGRQLALSDLSIETGRLGQTADGRVNASARLTRAEPATDMHLELESAYRVGESEGPLRLRQLRVTARGNLAGWQALDAESALSELEWADDGPSIIQGGSLQVRGKSTGGPFELRANAPRLALTPTGPEAESIDASLRLDGKLRGGSVRLRLTDLQPADGGLVGGKLATDLDLRMASGRLAGNLAGPIRWRAASRQLELPSLAGDLNFSPARPGTSLLKFASEADARVDLQRNSAGGHFTLRSEQQQAKGSWTLPRLDAAAIGFEIDVNRLDADALLATQPARGPAADKAENDRFDLSALHGLDLDGTIRFGHLKLAGLKLEQVKLPISLHGGRLVSAGHSLSLYGGSLEGSLNIAADDGRASYRAYLQNADLAPLLVDFGSRQKVAGTANFFVDVSSKAESRSSLLRDMQGLARLRLKGGSVPGIDVGQAIREWRGPLGTRQGARRAHRERESTAVGELTASFRIDGGVARSTDLKADSGMLRISGAGEINLPQRQIDYLTRVTLLVIPLGPDSGPLASLRGVTLPIRIKGPFDGPDWHLEPGANLPSTVLSAGQAAARSLPRVIPRSVTQAVGRVVKKAVPTPEKAAEEAVSE